MKKTLLLTLLIALFLPMEVMAQANVVHTTKFKLRTIKKGYTGDWAGSQTDTTANQGLNYNALKEEILWGLILDANLRFATSFQDSLKAIIGRIGLSATAPITVTTFYASGAVTVAGNLGMNTFTATGAGTITGKLSANGKQLGTIGTIAWADSAFEQKLMRPPIGWYVDSSMISINDTFNIMPRRSFQIIVDSVAYNPRGAGCNMTALLYYGTGAGTNGTAIITSGTIISGVNGTSATTINNATIPVGSFMWQRSAAITTKPTGLGVTVYYRLW